MNTPAEPSRSFEVVEGPYLVSRVNPHPHRQLRGSASTAPRLRTLARLEREREELRERLLDALHRAAPELGAHRSAALAAKRAVFNRRPPREDLLDHPVTREIPLLAVWADNWREARATAASVDGEHETALLAERAALTAWARDPGVDRATALSSPDLHRAVAARAATHQAPDKRMRKAEAALVRYFSRSTVKVSPYSLYTAVHFTPLEAEAPEDADQPLRLTSHAALRRLLPRQAARALAADPEARLGLEWVLTGGARREASDQGERLVVRRRRWAPPSPGLRAEAFGEEEVRLPMTGSWDRLVTVLEKRAAAPVRLAVLRDAVAAELGCGAERALGVLDKLIDVGVLVPWSPVPEQSPDFTRHWHRLASTLPGEAAARVASAFEETEAVLAGFSESDGAGRAGDVLRLQHLWSAAVGAEGSATSPVVEDCLVSRGVPVERDRTRAWSADLGRLMPLLFALDDQRVLSGALEQVFVSRYGRGGRCSDLEGFAQHARAAFPLTQELMGGEPAALAGADPELTRVLAARRRAVDHLVELGRSGGDRVNVDPAVVDEVAAMLPDREFAARRSFAVFGQAVPDGLVVNHLYGGRARYFSRFLGQLPEEFRDRVAEHVRRLGPEEADTVHMRSALGFNANLSPALADEELALRDEPTLVPGPSTLDLTLVHTPHGLRLVREDGREIDPVYTGFLVPHALPYDEMLVAMVADSPFFSFGDLTIDLHERWTEHGFRGGTPRIGFGELTLFRRRWGMDTADLSPRSEESPAQLHRRLNVERELRSIPEQVFVRPLQGSRLGPLERAMAPKPQHVDFLSRLHTGTAAKRLAHLGPALLVEEMLPGPDHHRVRSPAGGHASELFLELSTVPHAAGTDATPPSHPPGEARLTP
ncbi:lantibiotic dehydratase [Nocardiopsis sp. L17-MgMaSL7]|uniref:lantibiotic dehydratase n=1 Tax=Nocardiopsis sp. L17-MgMaSL7 TaxID=1938893 RepID=UPI000D71299A|nr:lantibiotic dehydratase [Nocardiopsis sp. L17-MgMaSL7]PWV44318.1 lantibiotic biosynthesis dehydratase-like protein [Nocardiopsis sp. L17-MgMaSL7]